ncbi:hypothetical protein [Rubellimicrobium mesophilum]|nr:hypothetical protein [Rubellimicrobium mesophilum]
MPMGHLMLGLLGGIVAFALALVAGLSLGMALLLYVGAGNLGLMLSVALQFLADGARRPPRRPAPAVQPTRRLRPIPVSH